MVAMGILTDRNLFPLSMDRQPSWRHFWSVVEKVLNLKELDGVKEVDDLMSNRLTKVGFNWKNLEVKVISTTARM